MFDLAKIKPQGVDSMLTRSATFLVLTIASRADAYGRVRSILASVGDLAKNVAARDASAHFSCTVGIGSSAWDRVTGLGSGLARPRELRPFAAIQGSRHTAPSTPGDLLFHIRAERRDLCFEFERQLLQALGDAVSIADVTVGFRYFDMRDLLGFVDGTANPTGLDVPPAVLVTEDDPDVAGGSYVVVQKYVHDMAAWSRLPTETQERIIGRAKLDNIELDDPPEGAQLPHKALATITDEAGHEYSILRHNMPFGSPGAGEFGTYFIGYARHLWVIEKMLDRMFIGHPPGLYDRLLDYSTALTGCTFFVPSASMLAGIKDD